MSTETRLATHSLSDLSVRLQAMTQAPGEATVGELAALVARLSAELALAGRDRTHFHASTVAEFDPLFDGDGPKSALTSEHIDDLAALLSATCN